MHKAGWVCDSAGMAQEVCVIVGMEDRARLVAIINDRNRPLKHIQRAQIILFSAARLPVLQVAREPARAARRCGAGRNAMPKPGGRAAARQNPAARQEAGADRDCRPGAGVDPRRAVRRGDPLDRPSHG